MFGNLCERKMAVTPFSHNGKLLADAIPEERRRMSSAFVLASADTSTTKSYDNFGSLVGVRLRSECCNAIGI